MSDEVRKPTVMKLVGPRGCGKTTFAQRAIIADVRIDANELMKAWNYHWLMRGVKSVVVDNFDPEIHDAHLRRYVGKTLTIEQKGAEPIVVDNEITWILICEGSI